MASTTAIAAASPPIGPDAELVALGRKLDDIIQRHAIATERCGPLWDEQDRLLEEWFTAHSRPDDERGRDEKVLAALQRIQDDVGLTALYENGYCVETILAEAVPISFSIMAIPATTIVGLKVKAKLAKFGAPSLWEEADDDADWGDLVARKLIDEVLSVTGGVKCSN